MGRRSTKTTKTGKFMNPTDQWRKQIRKKELKKNRQQRSAVREAVLKNKNPTTILAEIEEIEKMEIETGPEELPAEKGLKEKKRKLHETLQRIILFNERQNPQEAQNIKDLVTESEMKRRAMSKVYNSYRSARSQIELSDIPLPEGTVTEEGDDPTHPRGSDDRGNSSLVHPPGPPSGLPPDIQYPIAITLSEDEDDPEEDDPEEESSDDEQRVSDHTKIPPPPPPGPPPNYSLPLPLFPPSTHYPPPPPPPPGLPHRSHHPPLPPLFNKTSPHIQSTPVSTNQAPVISAQPQLRNVQAEVTKFMPTSLRVRRDQPKAVKAKMRTNTLSNDRLATKGGGSGSSTSGRSLVQGDAYDTFMAEMQGLL